MSIATLKKKSKRFQNKVSKHGFSIYGGHRNIGSVGSTNLAISIIPPNSKYISAGSNSGASVQKGYGGNNGEYVVQHYYGRCYYNDPSVIKPTVKTTSGYLSGQCNKGLCKTYPNNWVKTLNGSNMQSNYIENKKKKAMSLDISDKTDAGQLLTCNTYFIGGTKYQPQTYTKTLNFPVSSSEYQHGGLMINNCLPTPDCKQSFPMLLGAKSCKTNYLTPREAINDGVLPSNWMNC